MNLPEAVPQNPEYQPSAPQLERVRALRRFNRLFVYLPIGFFTLLIIVTTGILLYISLFRADEQTFTTLSAIADIIVIFWAVPMMLVCGVFPALFLAAFAQGRKRGIAPILAIRRLLWRLDNRLLRVHSAIDNNALRAARPLINIHARFAYIRTLIVRLKQLIMRS